MFAMEARAVLAAVSTLREKSNSENSQEDDQLFQVRVGDGF